MRVARTALCLALAGSLLGAGVAGAATKPKPKPKPKPVCNLLTDDAGDANDPSGFHGAFGGPNPVPNDASLDILGGDLASDKKTVTAVMKLAKAPGGNDVESPQGDYYYLEFQPAGAANPVYLGANTDVTGAIKYSAGAIVPSTGGNSYTPSPDVTVKGKVVGTSLVITAPLAAFKALADVKPGTKISGITGESFGVIDAQAVGLLLPGDTANESKPYIAGAPSCVVPVS